MRNSPSFFFYFLHPLLASSRSKSNRFDRGRRSPTPIPELDESLDRSYSSNYNSRTSLRDSGIKVNLSFDKYDKGKASYHSPFHLSSFIHFMSHRSIFEQNLIVCFYDHNLPSSIFTIQIAFLEDFQAKVMSDYHSHSRRVHMKQKSRNSRYQKDYRGDHDDRDDDGRGRRAGAKDLSKRAGNRLVLEVDRVY